MTPRHGATAPRPAADPADDPRPGRPNRRRVLQGLAAGGAAVALGGTAVSLASLWSPAYGDVSADKSLARFAGSIELAAAAAYALAAHTGKLTTPAVVQTAELFAGHHRAHAAAFGSYAGDAATAVANPKLLATLSPLITQAGDQAALVRVAFGMENALAATDLYLVGALTEVPALEAVASILPVESEHAAVLGHVLGEALGDQGTFMPTFLDTDAAILPAQYPISPGT